MIKPLPIKREGEQFDVEELDNGELPSDLQCQARYDASIELHGHPELPRGVVYSNGGASLACYMWQSPRSGWTHRHHLWADPYPMFPYHDLLTNEWFDMVKREAS